MVGMPSVRINYGANHPMSVAEGETFTLEVAAPGTNISGARVDPLSYLHHAHDSRQA